MLKLSLGLAAAAVFALASLTLSSPAHAQVASTAQKVGRFDASINGIGELNHGVSGHDAFTPPDAVTNTTTDSYGALVSLRYTRSPLLGFEASYKFARFVEGYTNPTANGGLQETIQINADGYSIGYVAHGPTLYGLHTFGGAGVGTTEFKPTRLGGESYINQARATYYWDLGVDKLLLSNNFGVRLQVRQLFYKTPDFGTNYLVTGARTTTLEPALGFYLRF